MRRQCYNTDKGAELTQTQTRYHLLVTVLLLLALAYVLYSFAFSSAFSGLGGYLSELALGDGVNTYKSLSSSTAGPIVLGSGPVVSTSAPASIGTDSATLAGSVSNLNGLPYASVWFEWGYAAGALVNSTAAVTIVAPGAQTAAIMPTFNQTVYYRIVSSTDAASYGNVTSFIAGGSSSASHRAGSLLILLGIVLATAIAVWSSRGDARLMIAAVVAGIVLLAIAEVVMNL